MFFHGGEDGVELSVVDDARGGVVVTPAGYDLTPRIPAALASLIVEGVMVGWR